MCGESARWCLSQLGTSRWSTINVSNFAVNGLVMDPFNDQCYGALIELLETEIKHTTELKERVLNEEEKPNLRDLVQKDIDASPIYEEWLLEIYPDGPPNSDC